MVLLVSEILQRRLLPGAVHLHSWFVHRILISTTGGAINFLVSQSLLVSETAVLVSNQRSWFPNHSWFLNQPLWFLKHVSWFWNHLSWFPNQTFSVSESLLVSEPDILVSEVSTDPSGVLVLFAFVGLSNRTVTALTVAQGSICQLFSEVRPRRRMKFRACFQLNPPARFGHASQSRTPSEAPEAPVGFRAVGP